MPDIRTFNTGATRDSDAEKIDYDGFLSPLVLERFGQYMHKHRIQSDGTLRDSDNWQRGIEIKEYIKSKWRHFMDTWKLVHGYSVTDIRTGEPVDIEEALCADLFNTMGLLHETLKQRQSKQAALEEVR